MENKYTPEEKAFVQAQLNSTSETINTFKKGLENTIKQIDEGYLATMLMYKVSFYLGVALIILSVVLAFIDGKSLLSIVFGGFGIGNTIFFFLSKPPKNLQDSRARLAQLQAALFNWFIDIYNWNSYLLLLDKNDQVTFESMKQVSDELFDKTQKTMALINQHSEKEITK